MMRRTNVDGTRHVIDACRRAKVRRLVHVSTVAAIGVSDGTRDATEDDPFNFAEHGLLDGYSETKRAAQDLVEAAVRAGEIDAVIACPTLMWGPYDAKPSTGRSRRRRPAGSRASLPAGWRDRRAAPKPSRSADISAICGRSSNRPYSASCRR